MINNQNSNELPRVIPQEVMLAVLNRCDDTREFLAKMWHQNPHLAKQGGSKVAMLLGLQAPPSGWVYEPSKKV